MAAREAQAREKQGRARGWLELCEHLGETVECGEPTCLKETHHTINCLSVLHYNSVPLVEQQYLVLMTMQDSFWFLADNTYC